MGIFLDFLEIGTSDFDTLIQRASDRDCGISIDPISFYLDRLPSPKRCKKLNMAISNHHGMMPVFYLHPRVIGDYGLPNWLRGCNAIGHVHPTVSRILAARGLSEGILNEHEIEVAPLVAVLEQHDVSGLYLLKVDTEGHDHIILHHFFDHAVQSLWPHVLIFESNSLSDSNEIHRLIARLIMLGYDIVKCETGGPATNTHLRLNIKRLKPRLGFTAELLGYYLEGYPEGYNRTNLPHQNTLPDAMSFCKAAAKGGVTYQYGTYEVREGKYLKRDPRNSDIKSWVLIGDRDFPFS